MVYIVGIPVCGRCAFLIYIYICGQFVGEIVHVDIIRKVRP